MAPSLRRATSARCRAFQSGRSWASRLSISADSERAQVEGHRAGTNRGQQFAGVFGEQKNGGEFGRLFQNFEQRVGGLFHKGRTGEDINAFAGFRGPIVDGLNHVANLVHLDHHLRRIGRDDEHVGMSLDEEPGLFLVRVAQIFASLDGFGKARVEVLGLRDAGAVRAASAEIGQAVGCLLQWAAPGNSWCGRA